MSEKTNFNDVFKQSMNHLAKTRTFTDEKQKELYIRLRDVMCKHHQKYLSPVLLKQLVFISVLFKIVTSEIFYAQLDDDLKSYLIKLFSSCLKSENLYLTDEEIEIALR